MIKSSNLRVVVVLNPLLGLFFIGFYTGEEVFDSWVGGEFILCFVSILFFSLSSPSSYFSLFFLVCSLLGGLRARPHQLRGRREGEGKDRRGEREGKEHTGSLSHTFGSVPCECKVPQPPRAYSVQRKVRDDSVMMVICSVEG